MTNKQPSEEQEIANAAYTWRKQVQLELVSALKERDITFEEAEFWFERWRRAKVREDVTEAVAKANR